MARRQERSSNWEESASRNFGTAQRRAPEKRAFPGLAETYPPPRGVIGVGRGVALPWGYRRAAMQGANEKKERFSCCLTYVRCWNALFSAGPQGENGAGTRNP